MLAVRVFRSRSKYETLVQPMAPSLNRVLERVFSMERALLGRVRLPMGGSILCMACLRHAHEMY